MRRYCTYFDHRYLSRGLAMIRSLRRFDPGCLITVLCLTPECEQILARLDEPNVVLLPLVDLERHHPDLLAVKGTRSMLEYYFTLSGVIVVKMLDEAQPDDIVTYVDSDLLFYSSVDPLYEQLGAGSVGLVSHRYHWWKHQNARKFGYFNVCWTSFRSDSIGIAAARWWRERCIEWCHDYPDGDRFADQKYLDQLFARFPNVIEITHPGANVAPWNLGRHTISSKPNGQLLVDGEQPLIFFHFQGLREIEPGLFLVNHLPYLAPFSRTVRLCLYEPYVGLLTDIGAEIGAPETGHTLLGRGELRPTLKQHLFEWRVRMLRHAARWMGHYISTQVLFIAPLPEPMMGQAYACQVFLNELVKRYPVRVIDLNKQNLGHSYAVLQRMGEVLRIALQARRLSRTAAGAYINLSQSLAGNLRDLLIFLMCWRVLPKTAVHLHGGPGMREVLAPRRRTRRFINRIFFSRLGAVIVLAQRYIDIFHGLAPHDRIRMVANFAPEFLYASEGLILTRFSKTTPLRVLFLSNLLPGKGHNELIAAFRSLTPELRRGVRLDFAGGFESHKDQAAFLASINDLEGVTYHGVADASAKLKLLHAAHVFCLPTYYRYEAQPISILEAYAAGCVVVTTDHSGIPDIFRPGINGYGVEKASAPALANVIIRMVRDPSSLLRIALANRQEAEKYSTRRNTGSLITIVSDLMAETEAASRAAG